MPLGVWEAFGDKLWGNTYKETSNFYWNCNFSLLFSLLAHFALIFFSVWNVSLACEQSVKNHFFSLQSENKNPHIFAYFRFKRIWAAHPTPIPLSARRVCTPCLCCGGRTDSPGGEGDGGSIFWKTREIGLPSYSKICTLWSPRFQGEPSDSTVCFHASRVNFNNCKGEPPWIQHESPWRQVSLHEYKVRLKLPLHWVRLQCSRARILKSLWGLGIEE